MSDFKKFQKDIRKLGGIWDSDFVYFSQFLTSYYADYRPYYPDSSDKDISIALYSPFNKKKNISVYVGNHKSGEPLKIFNVDKYEDIPLQFINVELKI